MRRSSRLARKPTVEAMEARALLSAGPVQVSVLNPRIGVVGEGPARFTFSETPKLIQVVVVSQAGAHPFAPLTQLVPGTIKINGIGGFSRVFISAQPDVNSDGIPDALVSIITNGSIRFPAGPGFLTVTGTVRHAPRVVWASAAPIDVDATLGVGLQQVQGYIKVTNVTGNTVYESVLVNSPPGGNVPPNPGTYTALTPNFPWLIYTGPGTTSQLEILVNFSRSKSGMNPALGTWFAGAMTVSSFTPPSIINWYLHLNAKDQFILNTTP